MRTQGLLGEASAPDGEARADDGAAARPGDQAVATPAQALGGDAQPVRPALARLLDAAYGHPAAADATLECEGHGRPTGQAVGDLEAAGGGAFDAELREADGDSRGPRRRGRSAAGRWARRRPSTAWRRLMCCDEAVDRVLVGDQLL